MAKAKRNTLKKEPQELDGVYILKIVMYLIVGSQWVFLTNQDVSKHIPLPVGLVLGGLFAMHDHFQIDRKIEFAILLIACFIGFSTHTGWQIIAL